MTQAAALDVESTVSTFTSDLRRLREEIGTMIVGQEDIVEGVMMCLLGGGHALLEGVPGLGKTMLVRTLAETILAAAQKGFASKRYQKVYQDYQRIVEEVMRTEKLPSSYKYYVKRYFAKIHPNVVEDK